VEVVSFNVGRGDVRGHFLFRYFTSTDDVITHA